MEDLQEEVLVGYPNETFVTYRGMRIFYKFKEQYQEWFFLATRIDREAMTGYPTLGSGWFQNKEDGIEWGKRIVDANREQKA